jgi:hypothetical protein
MRGIAPRLEIRQIVDGVGLEEASANSLLPLGMRWGQILEPTRRLTPDLRLERRRRAHENGGDTMP